MADKKSQRFTIDSDKEGAEVPTLTQLLYRKNVVKSQGSPGQGRQGRGLDGGQTREQEQSNIMTLEPTATIERPIPAQPIEAIAPVESMSSDIVLSQISSNRAASPNLNSATGESADRRVMPAAKAFEMPNLVRASPVNRYPSDGVASAGLRTLAEKAKVDASLIFEDTGEAFTLRSIVGAPSERTRIWNGMEISKTSFTDLLGRLQKFGFAEFSTLGAAGGNGNFDRTAFRTAFQAGSAEWLTLVRVKSAKGADAIVAVLSGSSIQMHIPAFHSADLARAKAA
jgi:hypothetical protein